MSPTPTSRRIRRRNRVALTLLTTAALVAGCSSSSSDSSDSPGDFSLAHPNGIEVPPNEVAGMPLPEDGVNKATAKLDELIKQVMEETGVPGVATAVVHGGKVIYAKGFGVRDVESGAKVDPDTVFQIASVSKAVSATIVAAQVSKGAVEWESKITDLMPGFTLADPWVSDNVTVGDGFSHRTGLPGAAGDKLEDIGYDRQYILDHLKMHSLEPFRISYAYANYGLTMSAEAVATKLGKGWEDIAAESIYQPLGMNSTSSKYEDFTKRENRATLHQNIDGKWVKGLTRDPDQQDPAGGVSSSINDLAKWMTMILAGGTYEGKEIYKPEDFQPAITAQIVSSPPKAADGRASFYGFGNNVNTSTVGRTGFNHSGAFLSGGATNYTIIPSADVGIVTLTNGWPIGVPERINDSFSDLVQTGKISLDYGALFKVALGPMSQPVGELVGKTPPASPAAAKPLSEYAGTYNNDYYGPATISEDNGKLVLALGPAGQTWPLEHWDGDTFTFELRTENAPPGTVSKATFSGGQLNLEYFATDGEGGKQDLGLFTR